MCLQIFLLNTAFALAMNSVHGLHYSPYEKKLSAYLKFFLVLFLSFFAKTSCAFRNDKDKLKGFLRLLIRVSFLFTLSDSSAGKNKYIYIRHAV